MAGLNILVSWSCWHNRKFCRVFKGRDDRYYTVIYLSSKDHRWYGKDCCYHIPPSETEEEPIAFIKNNTDSDSYYNSKNELIVLSEPDAECIKITEEYDRNFRSTLKFFIKKDENKSVWNIVTKKRHIIRASLNTLNDAYFECALVNDKLCVRSDAYEPDSPPALLDLERYML